MEKKIHQDDVATHVETPLPVVQEPYTPVPPTWKNIPPLPTWSTVPSDASLMPSPIPMNTVSESVESAQGDQSELALRRLSDAAQRIAASELQRHPGLRVPRLSRLASSYDISADIRRSSTALPHSIYSTQLLPDSVPDNKLSDLCPWLQDEDDESEQDIWKDHTDPLQGRHFPSSSETKRIEEEDIRRANGADLLNASSEELEVTQDTKRLQTPKFLRFLFTFLVVLAILALTFDTILIVFTALHFPQPHQPHPLPPSLTLSTNTVHYGQTITLYVHNFSSSTQVSLTRDIDESVFSGRQSMVRVQADGSQKVSITIDNAWKPGWHTLHAEDTTLHYTASATLHMDAGLIHPSHLLVSPAALDFGTGIVGADTLRQITLQNDGAQSLSWTATSDQPWLSIGPGNGIFSDTMQVMVGTSRASLLPGNYTGTISITANGEFSQSVSIQMTVLPLPQNAGAVLAISPAVLPFSTVDSMADPTSQSLVVNNPGTQPLYWTLGDNTPSTQGDPNHQASWLDTDATSGIVMPHATRSINISVRGRGLLPGIYRATLIFHAQAGFNVLNDPEVIGISLFIRPSCGLSLSTGSLSFTAVTGGNPSAQTLNLAATDSCLGVISWRAVSSAPWLTITPASGKLNDTSDAVMTVGVDPTGLKPATYFGNISVAVGSVSTQSVAVHLVVQAPPPPTAPIIDASPLNLNASFTLGQQDPPEQPVTIANTGRSSLNWDASVNPSASSWLQVSPAEGTIAPGQVEQLQVSVNTTNLSTGTYMAQIQVDGVDENHAPAAGSPQTITVTFVVQPPCTLALPSLKSLAFSVAQGDADPVAQSIILTASGNCEWPLRWNATPVGSAPSWLNFTPVSGSLANSNQTAMLKIAPRIAGLSPGTYSTQVSISALDAMSQTVQGSPQIFRVTLNVTATTSTSTA